MLGFLFRGLTAEGPTGAALFEAISGEARRPHWYVDGAIPDTLDGRFAMLTTIMALVVVRLERDGEAGDRLSVALTERFIAVMESEHRELGLGDPTLGRTVRKLVGMLANRTELWRSANDGNWAAATSESLYKDDVGEDTLAHSSRALKRFRERLGTTSLEQLEQGKFA